MKRILFIGDSIVAGVTSSDDNRTGVKLPFPKGEEVFYQQLGTQNFISQYRNVLEQNQQFVTEQMGYPGATSNQIVEVLNMIETHYDYIFTLVGINNRKLDQGLDILENSLREIDNFCKNNQTKWIIITYPPITKYDDQLQTRNFTSLCVDDNLRDYAQQYSVEMLDLRILIQEAFKQERIDVETYTQENYDGLHPTGKMQDIIFKASIQSVLDLVADND